MKKRTKSRRRMLIFGAAVLAEPVAMKLRGYRIGGKLIVRCRQGHLFTTWWIPGVSFKSLRFLWWRFQRCPVGRHWTVVSPVRESTLTDDERQEARSRSDIPIP